MGKNKKKAKAPLSNENQLRQGKPTKPAVNTCEARPLTKSDMQNKKATKKKELKEEKKQVTKDKPAETKEACSTPTKESAAVPAGTPNVVDAWFQRQRRTLDTIAGTDQESGEAGCDVSFMGMNTSFSQADLATTENCDATSTFDMWLERQKKELTTMTKCVTEIGAAVTTEEFKSVLAGKSQESLKEWKEGLAVVQPAETVTHRKASNALDAEHKAHIQQLERTYEKVEDEYSRHHDLAERRQMLLDESQAKKLCNLTQCMEDRIYGYVPGTPELTE